MYGKFYVCVGDDVFELELNEDEEIDFDNECDG